MPANRGISPSANRAPLRRMTARTPRWVVVVVCGLLAASTAGAIGLAVHGRESRDAASRTEDAASASAPGDATSPTTATASASPSASPSAAAPAATPRPNPCPLDPPYTGPIFVTSTPSATGNGSNGHLPASALTRLPAWANDTMGTPQYLVKAAASALLRLDDAFRIRFGASLDIDLTYRSFPDQVAIRAALGTIAAIPGRSRHGSGVALDLQEWSCIYGFGTEKRDWLVANGPSFGWVSPRWARQGASNPEYWHYEYTG